MAGKSEIVVPPLYDVHCHLLPGIDDGAKDWERTAKMLELAYKDGIRTIIATPHYGCKGFYADKKQRSELVARINSFLDKNRLPMRIYEGCEVYAGHGSPADSIYEERAGTLADSRYVLIEFPNEVTFEEVSHRVRELSATGFWPIVAHVERYEKLRKPEVIAELARLALIQVNADSIMGEWGFAVKQFTKKLLTKGLVSLVASDAHGIHHRTPTLRECYLYVAGRFGEKLAQTVFCENPRKIVVGEKIFVSAQ